MNVYVVVVVVVVVVFVVVVFAVVVAAIEGTPNVLQKRYCRCAHYRNRCLILWGGDCFVNAKVDKRPQ